MKNCNSLLIVIPYSGKFRMVQNFTVFTDRVATAKIKTTKISMGMGGENDDIIANERYANALRVNDRSSDCFSHVRPQSLA